MIDDDRHQHQIFRVIDMKMMSSEFQVESSLRHRKKRLLSRPTRISKSSNKVMMTTQVFTLIILKLLSMTTNAIIYLEDPVQAWIYDSLPDPPDKQSISNLFINNLTEGGLDNVPFKVGTPLHYLTVPSIDKGSPSASHTLSDELLIEDFMGGNYTSLLSNSTNITDVVDNKATTVSLYNETDIITNYTDTNITAPTTMNITNSTLFGRRTKSLLPSWDEPPISLSVDDELLPMKEISGEHTDVVYHNPQSINHNANKFITGSDGNSLTITELFGFFNDSKLVFPTESDNVEYVYYDSRQAKFGVDLGPKGNAKFVNIMLPPRWGDADSVVDSEEMEEEKSVTNVTDDVIEVEEVSANSLANITNDTMSETGTLSNQDDQSVRLRRLEDVDYLLGLQNASQTNGTIGEVNVTETNQTQTNTTNAYQTDVNLTISTPIGITNGTANATSTSDLEDFDDGQFDSHISSYFCLDDFERWRNSSSDVGVKLFDSSPTLNVTITIASKRAIAIMVQRGRCSFENKAELAMLLNKLLENNGKSDRIDHLIVYNNGTIDSKNNGTNGEEKLVEMFQIHENKAIDVGMLYITTVSGLDLLNRISDRQQKLGISPYLDYSWIRSHRESESIGDKQNITESTVAEKASTSDTITNGWYFPATLTRFCLSCGGGNDYGFNTFAPWGGEGHHYRPGEFGPTNWPNSGDIYPPPPQWVEVIRRLMIATLVILIVGPLILASHRWHTVGGTIRISTDENGRRRLRVISPSLEEFVEGAPDIVETNGTKLDRAQVFQLPEIVYRPSSSTDVGNDSQRLTQPEEGEETPPTRSEANHEASDVFESSSCCPICIDEFEIGEKLRVLPRCNHVFHIDCIMPWLTERQGCCPQCRTPVLPEELQRSRRPTSRRSSNVLRRFRSERQQGREESAAALPSSRLSEDVSGDGNTPVESAPQDRRRGNVVPFGGDDENASNFSSAGDALNVSSPEMIEQGVAIGAQTLNESAGINHAATVSADEIEVNFDAASDGENVNSEETANFSSTTNTDGSTDIETTSNDDAYEAFLNFLKEPSVLFTGDGVG